MEAKLLTAFNKDIQRYIERPSKQQKAAIMAEVKEDSLRNGVNFNRLFPAGTKRAKVFDEITYMLSVGGICKVSADKLAENTGSSVRTVKAAVKNVKQTGLFIVGGLADGKNKYVFVYKKHADFKDILANVFYVAQHNAPQAAQQPNAEVPASQAIEGEKSSPIYNIFNISKQEKDILKKSLRESVENEIEESQPQNEKAKAKEYLINPYQKFLYTEIKYDNLLHDDIKQKALIIALRAGSNLDENKYRKAMKAVRKLDKHITLGGEVRSIPALFDRLYTDRIKYSEYYEQQPEQAKSQREKAVYYDWLNENE